ncbi:hypothetical protein HHK36_018876 [Tetracentron sinense]|uniref:ubiquitinyl hydrolase 1 n=1 Tax=Tetracentron sinense TaxID=13715 RepID=A0A835DBP6_TETSI|nr:hypothetical protein HHK36_018876 [Tetracentron sinense]
MASLFGVPRLCGWFLWKLLDMVEDAMPHHSSPVAVSLALIWSDGGVVVVHQGSSSSSDILNVLGFQLPSRVGGGDEKGRLSRARRRWRVVVARGTLRARWSNRRGMSSWDIVVERVIPGKFSGSYRKFGVDPQNMYGSHSWDIKLETCQMISFLSQLGVQERDTFTRADLNAVADKLALVDPNKEIWTPLSAIFKPHHNSFTGNYDINVLIAAVEGKGKRVVWHDRRNAASSIDLNGSQDTLMGIVLNIPVKRFGGIWKSRHWVALRRIERVWYNLDSDLIAPQSFKNTQELTNFLDYIIGFGGELMDLLKRLRQGFFLKNSIAFVCVVISVMCLLVVCISMLRLPEVLPGNTAMGSYRVFKIRKVFKEERLGELGEMMIGMLPDDLAFTVFIPSERAFECDLRLRASDNLAVGKANNTYAILSRILGFSAVPRHLPSITVPLGKEISFDSISGFRMYIFKDSDGMLVVNRVRSERVDLRKKEIIVHVMNGVIMDAEFEQSVRPDYDED